MRRFATWTDDVDVVLAKAGVLGAVLALGLSAVVAQAFLVVIPVAVGTAALAALHLRGRPTNARSLPVLSPAVAGSLPAVVCLGLAALAVAIATTNGRSVPVLLATGGIGALVLAQVLFVDDSTLSPTVVLVEIVAASVVVRLATLFATPGFVGGDVWVHGPVWVDAIARSGSLEPLAESKYLFAPFYHVVGAVGQLLLGSARAGIYLTIGLFVPVSAVFVYGAARAFASTRWALFGTALYAFADQFVRWGLHVIPTSLGLAVFVVVLYGVLELLAGEGVQSWTTACVVGGSLAVVFTHQVSTAILLVVLAIAVAVAASTDVRESRRLRRRTAVLGLAFAATFVATLATWSLAPWRGGGAAVEGQSFLVRMLAIAEHAVLDDAGFLDLVSAGPTASANDAGATSLAGALVPYVELFGFALLLGGAVLGGLALLRDRPTNDQTLALLAVGGALFVGTFGFSLFGIRVFLPGRWIGFLYVPLVVATAVGLQFLARRAPREVVVAALVLFAIGYPTTMAVAEKATLDDPAFEDRYSRAAFTDAELAASTTAPALLPAAATSSLRTDHPYWRVFHPQAPGSMVTLAMGPDGPATAGPVVYRSYQSSGAAVFHVADGEGDASVQRAYDRSTVCPDRRNAVYANDDVVVCTTPTTVGEEV